MTAHEQARILEVLHDAANALADYSDFASGPSVAPNAAMAAGLRIEELIRELESTHLEPCVVTVPRGEGKPPLIEGMPEGLTLAGGENRQTFARPSVTPSSSPFKAQPGGPLSGTAARRGEGAKQVHSDGHLMGNAADSGVTSRERPAQTITACVAMLALLGLWLFGVAA